jgi:DNA-binding response OmpR family regulator
MKSSPVHSTGVLPPRYAISGRANRSPTVCVVDAKADDYRDWVASTTAGGCRLRIVATAEEALRIARQEDVDLWVVNVSLPGLSGAELCEILKAKSSRAAVYLVADQYSAAAERAAWQVRATLFGVKPGHTAWLGDWLSRTTRQRS